LSYFDHVRCSACKAMIDPEQVASRPGQGISCPRCGAPLSMGDLFGLKDAFLEEEQEELSLDDAIGKMKAPTASVAPPPQAPRRAASPPPPPAPPPAAAASGARAPAGAKPVAKPGPAKPAAAPKPAAARQLPGPAAPAAGKPTAAPAKGPARPPGKEDGAASSALDAMRALRKR
jgi:hypothetical protein